MNCSEIWHVDLFLYFALGSTDHKNGLVSSHYCFQVPFFLSKAIDILRECKGKQSRTTEE